MIIKDEYNYLKHNRENSVNKRKIKLIESAIFEAQEVLEAQGTCWDGYERVPGTKQYEKGSCRKKGSVKESDCNECNEADCHECAEGNAFIDKVSKAAMYGQEEIEIDGKTMPVTMSKKKAREIRLEETIRSFVRQVILEACHDGKKVTLNKPTSNPENPKKKSKVYVSGDGTYKSGPCKGQKKAKKVQFGDPNMRIKKSNPEARSSFRARHKCSEKKPKDSAGYWSCKAW
jgi:hypothetical protein